MADSTSPPHGPLGAVGIDARPGIALEGHRIADSIARFAAHLQGAPGDSVQLSRLIVDAAVTLIPGADHAAVRRLVGSRHLETPAATDAQVPCRLMELQNTLGEGPCLDAVLTGTQIRVADVRADPRWPRYSPAAAALGVVGALSTPMELRDHTTGCLAVMSNSGAFDDEAVSLARIFAVHAGIALSGALRQESLNAALTSRGVIGQAKGILMERFKVTEGEAFAALVKISADKNVKLRAVAEELCRTGYLDVNPPQRAAVAEQRQPPVSR